MLFLGLIYAWSNFTKYFVADFGWSHDALSWIFTVTIIFFCVGNVCSGLMHKKVSTRVMLLVAAVLLGAGFILVSFTKSLVMMFIAYGVLAGTGVGIAYNGINSSLMRWFPDKPGFASGVLLMTFGLSTLAIGSAAVAIIDANGGQWSGVFLGLGIIFIVVLVIAALIIKKPDDSIQAAQGPKMEGLVEIEYKQVVRKPYFWLIYLWGIIIGGTGLAVIGKAYNVADSLGAAGTLCTLFVGIVSVSNGIGRLIFGTVLDALGPRRAYVVDTVTSVVALLFIVGAILLNSIVLLFIGYIFLGAMYGGASAVGGGAMVRLFGPKSYAMNMPVYMTHLIIAAIVGPRLTSALYNEAANSYQMVFIVLLIANVVAVLISALMIPKKEDERTRKAKVKKA